MGAGFEEPRGVRGGLLLGPDCFIRSRRFIRNHSLAVSI